MATATLEEIRQLQDENLKQAEQLKQDSQATLEKVRAIHPLIETTSSLPWGWLAAGLGIGMAVGVAIAFTLTGALA